MLVLLCLPGENKKMFWGICLKPVHTILGSFIY